MNQVKNAFSSKNVLTLIVLFIIEAGNALQGADITDWFALVLILAGVFFSVMRTHQLSWTSNNFTLK